MKSLPAVLDASALLAIFFSEPGAELVVASLETAVMSAVNYAEVLTRLIRNGPNAEQVVRDIASFKIPILDWTEALAIEAADLAP